MQDLSLVTDTLIAIVTDAVTNSPLYTGHVPHFSVNISGQHPETPTGTYDCELSVYLFHIGADKFLANQFWSQQAQNGGKQPIAFEPLSLDLWYMLSAQSKSSYVNEQLVLGLAMEGLHQHGTFTLQTPTPPPNSVTPSEATLVLESPTFDEMSRLWQALGIPLRTTAQYRVSVVFLTPDEQPPAAQPNPNIVNLEAAPAGPITELPHLVAARRTLTYTAPGPSTIVVQQSPASTAPAPAGVAGQTLTLDGLGLAGTDHVLLVSYDASGAATETDITTTWNAGAGLPFKLRPPEGAATPPGRYDLVIARPSAPTFRSNAVPLGVAPWINPAGGPLLHPGGTGIYTLDVRNVPTAGAQLRIGTVQLGRVAAGTTPSAGQWQGSGSQITFAAPADLPLGQYQIGLRAGDVEADPALWAVV
jgi:Pvc16 N-terminal domain